MDMTVLRHAHSTCFSEMTFLMLVINIPTLSPSAFRTFAMAEPTYPVADVKKTCMFGEANCASKVYLKKIVSKTIQLASVKFEADVSIDWIELWLPVGVTLQNFGGIAPSRG